MATCTLSCGSPGREMQDLGTLGGKESWAESINDKGQTVGYAQTAAGEKHAFLWEAGRGMQDLGTLGGKQSSACYINGKGQVVGLAEIKDGNLHAFLWETGRGMRDIRTIGPGSDSTGGLGSQAIGINSVGQIVGWTSGINGTFAFLYDDGKTTGLDPMVDPASGWRLNSSIFQSGLPVPAVLPHIGGLAVNDSGQIAVNAWNRADEVHVLLLTPVPETAVRPVDQKPAGPARSRPLYRDRPWHAWGRRQQCNRYQQQGPSCRPRWTVDGTQHPFLWDSARGMQDLGTLGGRQGFAASVNGKGQVVGQAETQSGETHAFLWQQGSGMLGHWHARREKERRTLY